VVLEKPAERAEIVPSYRRMPVALGILVGMVLLTIFDVVPLVTAVLMAALGVSPYPFAVAVLIAASAAYSTPVSTPVVTLVVDPGRYKFTDFVKVGLPLLFLTYLVTLVVAPLIFPFSPS
jgi:di/tricarboxylate transporter